MNHTRKIQGEITQAHAALEIGRTVGSLYSQGLALRILAETSGDAEQFAASVDLLDKGNACLEAARTRELWADWELAHAHPAAPGRAHVLTLYAAALTQFDSSNLPARAETVRRKLETVPA